MNDIVGSIKRVTDIMGEISSASTEQSAGVAQVGEAITQMDKATQQNAALVEESAAAAESLKGQASRLLSSVAVFKLSKAEAFDSPAPYAQSAAAIAPGFGRRGLDRAKHAARPAFKAKQSIAPATASEAGPHASAAKSGTDDWASF